MNELVGQIAEDMKLHSGHISRADFQHKVLNDLTSSQLPLDHAVAIMDFSENYSLMHQDQIESAYFSQKQITLHPVYLYRHAPDSTEENIKIQKEAIVMISDSLNHNSTAVYSFTCQLLKYIKNNPGACDVSVLHRFSDNCSTQYKCIESFTHLQMYEQLFSTTVVYHYTEAGHGKSPSDGIRAATKRKLDRLILTNTLVPNAYSAYLALQQNEDRVQKKPNASEHLVYLYVPSSVIKRDAPPKLPGCKTITGTQSFHQIKYYPTSSMKILECNDLSCSCDVCLGLGQGPCFYRSV